MTPQHEHEREVEKGKSDAVLAGTFDDPPFSLFSICSTHATCAAAACVEHSSGVFRHEVSVNVRVCAHELLYTLG